MPKQVSRRTFLRAGGVALALPSLEAMTKTTYGASAGQNGQSRQRALLAIDAGSIYAPFLFPERAGRDYEPTSLLRILEDVREDFTVISGVSHPHVGGGHFGEKCLLTGAVEPMSSGFKNTVSIDQLAAERIGLDTRFSSLVLNTVPRCTRSISWAPYGTNIPALGGARAVYSKLFLNGTKESIQEEIRRLEAGKSILDRVGGGAKQLRGNLSAADRQRLDQYLAAVRDVEKQLAKQQAWADRPKPQVDLPIPAENNVHTDLVGHTKTMLDVVHLALQTDSTRVISLVASIDGRAPMSLPGVTMGWHDLDHHGGNEEKLKQLKISYSAIFEAYRDFFVKLKNTNEQSGSLLDRTTVLVTSGLGNASNHSNRNLPTLLVGGGFRHGQHLAFDRKNNDPLANLYLSMLHRLGVEVDSFATSTGTMRGLEMT